MSSSASILCCNSIVSLLVLPVVELMKRSIEAYNGEVLSEFASFNHWSGCFYFLFWSFIIFLLFWNRWKHLLQRWGFPLFRILISLESAIGCIRRLTTDSRMIDVTLGYNL